MGENQKTINITTTIDDLVAAGEVAPNLLRGDTMRASLEYKNQLKNAGDIYIGTGETVTNDDKNKTVIYRTKGENIIDAINKYGEKSQNTHVKYAEEAAEAGSAKSAVQASNAAQSSKILAYNVNEPGASGAIGTPYICEIAYGTSTPRAEQMKNRIFFVVEE